MVIRDSNYPTPPGLSRATQAAATSLGVELNGTGVRDLNELEAQVSDFAKRSNGGLVVFPSRFTATHIQRITTLATHHKLPAVYPLSSFAEAGGLISYGVNTTAVWSEAASYIDRILRGATPGELPVQERADVDIVVNLITAKALGLTPPPKLLARSRKVIK